MSNTNSDLILCFYGEKAVYICLKKIVEVDTKKDGNKEQEKNDESKNNMELTLPDAIAIAVEGSFFCFRIGSLAHYLQ
jgi:hypothetical protein